MKIFDRRGPSVTCSSAAFAVNVCWRYYAFCCYCACWTSTAFCFWRFTITAATAVEQRSASTCSAFINLVTLSARSATAVRPGPQTGGWMHAFTCVRVNSWIIDLHSVCFVKPFIGLCWLDRFNHCRAFSCSGSGGLRWSIVFLFFAFVMQVHFNELLVVDVLETQFARVRRVH